MPKINVGLQFRISDDGDFEGFNIAFGMSDLPSLSSSKGKKRRKKKQHPLNNPNVQYLLSEFMGGDEDE